MKHELAYFWWAWLLLGLVGGALITYATLWPACVLR